MSDPDSSGRTRVEITIKGQAAESKLSFEQEERCQSDLTAQERLYA
jgi:hypothetical protein